MRVLVTGSAGRIGRALTQTLMDQGHEFRTFDRVVQPVKEGVEHFIGDLRDIYAVRRAVQGVEAVLHLGALAHDGAGSPEDVLSVNVQGTWNALLASAESGVRRFVYFSSVNSLGNFGGHRPSAYLPIDDDYPRHPMTPYQLSKHLGEETCRMFNERHGIVTVCLRPMYVADLERNQWGRRSDSAQRIEWLKRDYWAYVDLRDVVDAAILGLTAEGISHDAFLLAADDTMVDVPTAELVETYYPDTPWPKAAREEYLSGQPYRALVDCSHAKRKLGWRPRRSWREFARQNDEASKR